jgi:hypothetical protein
MKSMPDGIQRYYQQMVRDKPDRVTPMVRYMAATGIRDCGLFDLMGQVILEVLANHPQRERIEKILRAGGTDDGTKVATSGA